MKSLNILKFMMLLILCISCISCTKKVNIHVNVSEKANSNNPTAIEVVVVYDKKLLPRLMDMTAAQWFKIRNQFKRDYSSKRCQYKYWEWVPGQDVQTKSIMVNLRPKGVFIFTDYITPGPHRWVVSEPKTDFTIFLEEKNFRIVQ